jgi:hypothetical protein
MRIGTAVPFVVVAVVLAGASLVPAGQAEITTVGTVVSTGRDSMVVKIDDHGHKIPFAIGKDTILPADLAVGSRVSVVYHPTGVTGQMADRVTLLSGAESKSGRGPAKPTTAKPKP